MTAAAQYPIVFQLGKCNSLHEETKGTASFRMYPDLTGRKIHIEVWTPDMARRKQKCVTRGTELSTVAYYYGIFVDYSVQNSTKVQLIHIDQPTTVIDGEYNALIGTPVFNKFDKACFELEKMKKDVSLFIGNRKGTFRFKTGGYVKVAEHTIDEIILPPASQKDCKLEIIPRDGVNSNEDAVYFKMPETNNEAPTPTEHPIKTMKRLIQEQKQLKKILLKAADDLDAETYHRVIFQYEANQRYIQTVTTSIKKLTF